VAERKVFLEIIKIKISYQTVIKPFKTFDWFAYQINIVQRRIIARANHSKFIFARVLLGI
jgi:hypothetical protein